MQAARGLVEPCILSWPGEFPVEMHYMELTPPWFVQEVARIAGNRGAIV